jgi:beta-mannosidase
VNITKQQLTTGWRVREVPREGTPPHNYLPWLPAQVPGGVHLDLLRAGVIPDPLARLHERGVAWVDESDWVYETTFAVDGPPPACAFLKFHGLDTLAEIALNDEVLGRTENMFIPHEFPVGGKLKSGENTLRVTFRSALRVGRERQAAWDAGGNDTLPYHWDNWAERAFVRKAQYQYGWDWGPVLRGCGLWQPVELITVPVVRILDWKHSVEFTDDNKALVTVMAEVERAPGQEDTPLTFTVWLGGNETEVPVAAGNSEVAATVTVDNPHRWQPNGYGEAAVYNVRMMLASETNKVNVRYGRIGLRTVELVREPDADGKGEGFKFRVNGVDVYAKGANWIPDHSFPSEITKKRLGERVTQARDAGMTMLRIWGGGFYESETFYHLCDQMGILVWQDFPYGCSYYPDTGEYADLARVEATAAVKRIRNHPSLALWCGNNENHTMFEGNWTGTRPPRLLGEHLYHEILPAVVEAEDPLTPYWPGSPYGGPTGDSNSADFGDCHNWDVWHGRGDWVHYTENNSRFCSEFGFASSCGLGAWDQCLAPADRSPHSPAVRWHDKTRKGYDTYLGYIALHFPEAQSLEDLVYYSQINQAEALKFGVEHYRRRKGRNWGTLFWQLNDCWPVQSWAVIDSTGEPKAAYFACKKFYAPVLLSLVRDGERVEAHLVSDLLAPLSGTLTFTLATLDGETLLEETPEANVAANAAAQVAVFSLSAAAGREREVYVSARFTAEDGTVAENVLLLCEPKDLQRADPGLAVTVVEDAEDGGLLTVTVSAQRFAPYVWLRRTDNGPLAGLCDNFFPLRPGEMRTLSVAKTADLKTADELRGRLVARML